METKIYFKETQRFTQWWVWILLLVIGFFAFKPLYVSLVNNQQLSTGQWIGILILLLVLLLFLVTKLETRVQKEGIYVRFIPFLFKTRFIAWDELELSFVRKYSPLREYGGWGWRISGKGMAYNVNGNQGLQLVFKTKKALLIGTQKPQELDLVLKELGMSGRIA